MKLTEKLNYEGYTFYFAGLTKEGDRIYRSLDELIQVDIITAPADYDGELIGIVPECFRESEEDDLIRYFNSETGIEEKNNE